MPGIETSMYNTAAPKPLDPFAMENQLLGIQKAQQGLEQGSYVNQLLQRDVGLQDAQSQAYSAGFDPNSGMIDPAKAGAAMRGTPYAYGMPGAIGAAQGLQTTNTANAGSIEGLNATESARATARLSGLQQSGNLSFGSAVGSLSDLLATGQITPKTFEAYRNQLVRQKPGLDNFVTSLVTSGIPGSTDATTLQTTPDGTVTGTKGQQYAKSVNGYGAGGEGYAPPGSGGAVPMPAGPYANPPPGAVLGKPNAGQPGYLSAPPAGELDAQQVVGKESGQSLATDQAVAKNYKQRVFPLEQAIPLLDSLGPGAQGVVGQKKADFQNLYQSITGESSPDDMGVAQNKLKKYLTQYVNMNGNGSTLGQFASSVAGSPNTDMANLAASDVAKMALGVQRMQQAQVASYNGAPSGYANYAKTFSQNQDPRAYAFDLLPPVEQDRLSATLKGPERTRFLNSLKIATSPNTGVMQIKPRQPAVPQSPQVPQ